MVYEFKIYNVCFVYSLQDVLLPKAVMLFLPSPLVCKCMTIPSVQVFGSHAIIRFLQEIGEYRDEGHHDEDGEPYGHHRLADVVQ